MSSFTFPLGDLLPVAATGPDIAAGAFGLPLPGGPTPLGSGFQNLLAQIVGTDTDSLPSPLYSSQSLAPATPNLRATSPGAAPGQGRKTGEGEEAEVEEPVAELDHQLHLSIQPQRGASIGDFALPANFPVGKESPEEKVNVQHQDANVYSWTPFALPSPAVVQHNATWDAWSIIENRPGSEDWPNNQQGAIMATILATEQITVSEPVTGEEVTERTQDGSETVFPSPPKGDDTAMVPTLSAICPIANPQPQDEAIAKDSDVANRPSPAATMTDRPAAGTHQEVRVSRPGPDVPTPSGVAVRLLLKQNTKQPVAEIEGSPKKAAEIPLGNSASPFHETTTPDRSAAKTAVTELSVSRMPPVEAPQRKPAASVSGTRSAAASEQNPSQQLNAGKEAPAIRSSERVSGDTGAAREDEPPPQRGTAVDTSVRPVLFKTNAVHEATPPTAAPPQAQSVLEADAVARLEEPIQISPPAQPLRHLRVSIGASGSGNVEVLVNQRPGGVEVSIHSMDQQVRDTLRSGLTTLIESFDRRGVAAETLPAASTVRQEPSNPLVEWMQGSTNGHETVMELAEQQATDGGQQQFHRQPQWELAEENRRRRGQDVGAWKKYLEEYSWLNQ